MVRDLTIEHDRILLDLQPQEIASLLAGSSVQLAEERLFDDYTDKRREITEGAICLVGTATAHPCADGYDEAVKRLEHLLDRLYLARFTALPAPSLTLAAGGTVQSQIGTGHRLLPPPSTPFDRCRFSFMREPTAEAAEALRDRGSFSGLYHVCSCGCEGCGADFALIHGAQLLAYMETGSGEVWVARFLPVGQGHASE